MRFSLSLILFCVLLLSCSSDLDFEQAEGTEFEQNFVITSIYYQANTKSFLTPAEDDEIPVTSVSKFDVFSPEYINKNIKRLEYQITAENSFKRSFDITFEFLDSNNGLTGKAQFVVPENSTSLTETFVFENESLYVLKTSTQVRIKIELIPDTSKLDPDEPATLKLKSAALVKLLIN